MPVVIKKPESEFAAHLNLESKPVVGTVQVAKVTGKTVQMLQDTPITLNKGVLLEAHKMCTVTAGGSHTVNLGNYESAKVSVSISIPCLRDDIDETYEFATQWVSEKMEEAMKQTKV